MSGVKVTNERPAQAFPDVGSVVGEVDDEDVDWEPDTSTGIPPGNDAGDVLTWDGDSWEPEAPTAGTREWELWNEGGDPMLQAHGSFGASETIDPTLGNVHTGTLDADCTVTLSAPSGTAASLLLWLTQDGTGGRDITWAGSVAEIGAPDTTAGVTNLAVATTADTGASWVVAWVGAGEPVADAHVADTSDAHAASAVSFDPTGLSSTDAADVQEAIEDLDAAIDAIDTSAAGIGHVHVAYETHTADGSTTTFTLDQAYEPGSVMAWNRSTGALLGVTEVLPDQATISAAGSAGNLLDFHYAASVI